MNGTPVSDPPDSMKRTLIYPSAFNQIVKKRQINGCHLSDKMEAR